MLGHPEVIQLFEGAFIELPVKKEDIDAVAGLHNLHGKVAIMIEALAADQ